MNTGPRGAARRLFLALWPTPAERAALLDAASAAVAASGGLAVPTLNLHVTLAFLGAVPEARIAEFAALARELGAGAALPELRFTRLEHWRRPQILAACTHAEPAAAAQLAADLKRTTAAAGFFPDLRPFRAHVTVARQVQASGGAMELPPVTWRCATLALAHSRSGATGPLYSVLDSWLLGKRENMRGES